MAEIRRGYAMLLTAGDSEISGALADGIMAARLPAAKPLEPEKAKVVSEEIKRQDRQRIARNLRVALHREPVDYASLCADAEIDYGESLYEKGAMQRFGEKLLIGYAIVVLAFCKLFEKVGV